MKVDAMYFCNSPYNLITAITLMKMNNENADIYIYGTFTDAKLCADRLRSLNLFHSVILLDWTLKGKFWNKNGLLGRLQVIKNYLFTDRIVKSFICENVTYNKIYSIQKDLFCRTVFLNQIKHNHDTELIFYEEGNGVYTYDRATKIRRTDLFIRRILFGKKAIKRNTLYVYSPELFKKTQSSDFLEIKKIEFQYDSKNIYNFVFNYIQNNVISEPFIILDTIKPQEYDQVYFEIEQIYERIANILDKERIILKPHPRTHEPINLFKLYTNQAIPFEVVMLNSSMNNKVLISYVSTSTITPFLLQGDEPYLVLLYKMINDNILSDRRDIIYAYLQSMYKDKAKIFIPESYDELERVLLYINSRI